MKKLFSGVLVILLLLITSCSAEMPEVVNPDSSPGTTHRFLSVKEVSNRLHGIWPTLPKSNPTTRNNDEPQVDSVFVLPGGQYVGTYNPTVGDLFADPNVQYIEANREADASGRQTGKHLYPAAPEKGLPPTVAPPQPARRGEEEGHDIQLAKQLQIALVGSQQQPGGMYPDHHEDGPAAQGVEVLQTEA